MSVLAAFFALTLSAPAVPQTITASVAALEQAKRQSIRAAERAAMLETRATQATDAAARARAAEAAVAARIQSAESDVAAAEARIALVEQLRARQRARLAAKQAPIVRLAAALQTMARRPALLALAQPGSIADVARVRALLESRVPLVRERTAGLRAEVAQGVRLRAEADRAVATLKSGRGRLLEQRRELARLETQHRIRSQAFTDSAMHEQDRAIALAEQARDIVELMGELDGQAALRDRLASLPGPILRPALPGAAPAPPPDSEQAAAARLAYRLPVIGRLVTGMGEISRAGVTARGLTLATGPQAQVVAPARGRIAYAGPFRGYGEIVILDHGGGWTTLVTDLATLGVRAGEQVDQGSPIGRTAADRPRVTIELRHAGRPIDITPLVATG